MLVKELERYCGLILAIDRLHLHNVTGLWLATYKRSAGGTFG